MADQLDMNGLSLHDGQHGPNEAGGRSTYIPPHMRGVPQGPPPAMNGGAPPMANGGGLNDSMWAGPPKYVVPKSFNIQRRSKLMISGTE